MNVETASLQVLTADQVEAALPLDVVYDTQRKAFEALARGTAVLPPRLLVTGADGATAFCYAARTHPEGPAVSKFGSVNPQNPTLGLPAVNALLLVLDPATGEPRVVMDGTAVTRLRTAAASAVAVDRLARPDAHVLAVFGTGVQARAHVHALLRVRDWSQVLVVDTDAATAKTFAESLSGEVTVPVSAVEASEALERACVVALCTTSREPVIETEQVRAGTTVVSIGSFESDRSEIPAELLSRAYVVVDDTVTCATDAGPVVTALTEGLITKDELHSLGDVLIGGAAGRTSDDQIVVHISVGLGIQDAAAAEAILAAVTREGS